MASKQSFTHTIGGKTLTLEVSSIAAQANAAVIAKIGGTAVLATAVMAHGDSHADYLPLKVDYEERFYAVGKILGSRYMRREGRPSEDAVLSARLIDRTIRPLFDYRMRRDVQVVVTVLAYDEENDPIFPGLIAASAALSISDIPWGGPIGGVQLARVGNSLVPAPGVSDLKKPELRFETFAAGPRGRINMIELAGSEAGEDGVYEAFATAQNMIDDLISFQEGIVKKIGKPKAQVKLVESDAAAVAAVREYLAPRLEAAVFTKDKSSRQANLHTLKEELFAHAEEALGDAFDRKVIDHIVEEEIDALVHSNALTKGLRPDGRAFDEVRPLAGEVRLFDRNHGSALFERGSTQALAAVTLAPPGSEQVIETISESGKRRFMLHYNFPPYSVGEVGPFRSPGRREIGHGALAEKALRPMLPDDAVFPYTIRIVSEIVSSNGSSSMATVCAGTLAMMDAGVPLKKMVAGIAMGLMSEADGEGQVKKFKVLTDLQGPEDFYGDMDFKVAGTKDGITAVQLDTKIKGLTLPIIKETLAQSKTARLQILTFMSTVLSAPRAELSPGVPAIALLSINPEKIGLVIGPGGKTINGMIAHYELAAIDIEEDGRVYVAGLDREKVAEAVAEIKAMTKEYKVGEIVEGRVVRVLDFGAIVDIGGGKDGMVHVSELKDGFVKKVDDVVKMGDFLKVKIIRVDDDGHIGLSLKQMPQEK